MLDSQHTSDNAIFTSESVQPTLRTVEEILIKMKKLLINLPESDPNDRDRHVRFFQCGEKTVAVLGEYHGDPASLNELRKIISRFEGVPKQEILFISEEGEGPSLGTLHDGLYGSSNLKIPNVPPAAGIAAQDIARRTGIALSKIIPSHFNSDVLQRATLEIQKKHRQLKFEDVVGFLLLMDYMNALASLPPYPKIRKEDDSIVFQRLAKVRSEKHGIDINVLDKAADSNRDEIKILLTHLRQPAYFQNLYGGSVIKKAFDEVTVERISQILSEKGAVKFIGIFAGSLHIPSVIDGIRNAYPQATES